MNRRPALLIVVLIACLSAVAWADPATLRLDFADRLRISERSNLSRTEDGRYVGLMNRQVTGYLSVETAGDDEFTYSGRMLVYEETLRDMNQVGRRVDDSFAALVTVTPQGGFTSSSLVPRYLGIPTLPDGAIRVGDTWEASASVIVALPDDIPPVTLPVEVAYRYTGTSHYGGLPVHVIEAGFATRYPPPPPPDDGNEPDSEAAPEEPLRMDIDRIAGRHSLTITIPAGSDAPFFIRDEIEEQYELPGHPVTLVRGHTLLFVRGLSAEDQHVLARTLTDRLNQSDTEDVTVDETATGTRLTVEDLRFLPDQAVLVSGESERLAGIADALRSVAGMRFLIVGHTADVGSAESQETLSWERARVIAAELVRLGMDPARFDLEGRGGTEPVATNTTEEGRKRNRRVEIYVLEE